MPRQRLLEGHVSLDANVNELSEARHVGGLFFVAV